MTYVQYVLVGSKLQCHKSFRQNKPQFSIKDHFFNNFINLQI